MYKLRIFLCSLKRLYDGHFVSYSELENFKQTLPDYLKNPQLKNTKLKAILKLDFKTYQLLKQIDLYLNHRERLNKKFIQNEQKKPYEIEGNRLDKEQIAAVVASEDAELILASAGSGKSASLLAKVNYLIQNLKIPAENILVIAFTRKVVKELNERMKGSGVEICTFHSFGNKIIKNLKSGKDLKLVPDDFLERTITKILKNEGKIEGFDDEESFKKLIISALQLQKNEQVSLKEFKNRILKIKDEKERKRAEKFFKYYAKFVRIYGKILRDNKLYDFSDMLSWSTRIIKGMPPDSLNYQYILVDEVQDLSKSKSLLLKAILEKSHHARLFAVGDDWQSIYRFAGSNLGVIKDFEKTFNRVTYRGIIRKTYRFGQPTAWVSEYFIRKNPHQSKKKVKTFKKSKTPINIHLTYPDKKSPDDYNAINQEITKLYQEYGEDLFKKRVQIISRYNKDLYRLVDPKTKNFKNARITEEKEDGITIKWRVEKACQDVQIAFCSMHKSKGITRDIVFVINMNEGEKGMPSTRTDEPILATMLAKPDLYPLAEERRLFYVAITRATERTILIANAKKPSRFVKEIARNLDSEIAEALS